MSRLRGRFAGLELCWLFFWRLLFVGSRTRRQVCDVLAGGHIPRGQLPAIQRHFHSIKPFFFPALQGGLSGHLVLARLVLRGTLLRVPFGLLVVMLAA